MRHLGDITKINGYEVPIVDCIIGGSPCQDLSVAGKRAGLDGERSGLYIEQVRIVKEMRERDVRNGRSGVDVRPRYMVWENVPGAFSSNKGEDFRIVLEEIAKVCDKDAVIPEPPKGKWTNHGCIVGDGWSVAWRVLDAQFWGVPQRRRRIALVADFGGQSAPEILFVRQSVSGHTDESKPKRKGAATDAQGGIGADDRLGVDHDMICFEPRSQDGVPRIHGEVSPTLNTAQGGQRQPCITYPLTFEPGIASREGGHVYENVSGTLRANAGDNQMATAYPKSLAFHLLQDPIVSEEISPCFGSGNSLKGQGSIGVCYWDGGQVAGTLTANNAGGNQRMPDKENFNCVIQIEGESPITTTYCIGNGQSHDAQSPDKELCKTLNCMADPMKICIVSNWRNGTEGISEECYSTNHGSFHTIAEEGICATLQATDYKDPPTATYRCGTRYIVRRLTPLECERLQGYPDGWTDIGEWVDSNGKTRQTSDAARYKALGNSIALPPWKWVLKRLCACYERDATMASLFDGIGGFPYLWEQLNGKGSCLWASEIEEFPMAVTKVRIGE